MRYILIICFLSLGIYTQAQRKFSYTGGIELGVVNGSMQTNGYAQVSAGLKYKSLSAAVGTGLDYYRYRTIPAFAEIKKEFGQRSIRPFVLAAAGVNITWPTTEQKNKLINWWQNTPVSFHPGFFAKTGAGIMFNAKRRVKCSMNVAWSYKTVVEKYTEFAFTPWPQDPQNSRETTLVYQLNRLSVGFGVNF